MDRKSHWETVYATKECDAVSWFQFVPVHYFLTSFDDRRSYVANARAAIRPGGHAIVATFAEDGPTRCSGLSVARYSPEGLAAEFGAGFVLARGFAADHATPSGPLPRFSYALRERLP